MANFFLDNEDILFHFSNTDLESLASLQEDGFKDASLFDYAPANAPEAVDGYRRTLEVVGEVAANIIAPRSEEVDREGNVLEGGKVRYARGIAESLKVLSRADLMGFTLPRRFGGLNFPNLIYTMAIEIVSRADASLMNIFGLQGIADTINAFASEELKAKYLPLFAAGKVTGAMALTEPEAGSDLQRVQLKATPGEDGMWRLNGVKRFITNGCGEVLLVLARSEPDEEGGMGLSLFLCERSPEVRVRRLEDKLGIHGSPTCELQFNDAKAYLIGERRRGLVSYVMPLMNGARIGIAAQSLGIAEAAFREARNFASTRRQFGREIEKIPPVADMLVEMKTAIEAARALTYEASLVMDEAISARRNLEASGADAEARRELKQKARQLDRLASMLTPMSKYYASEMCVKVAGDAIQILGGSGYMRDYPVERYYRDARITTIYEGTSQLQIVAAVRAVTAGTAEKYFAKLAEAGFPKPYSVLAGKLEKARILLQKAVDFVKKKGGMDYIELVARKLVDMAIDILIGYLLLRHAPHSKHKRVLARRFIVDLMPRVRMNYDLIRSFDRSSLKSFDSIVGPPQIE